MIQKRKRPFIWVTWLSKFLSGENLCKWSVWYRIFHYKEGSKEDFDNIHAIMKHADFRNQIQQRYIENGFEVLPEYEVCVSGKIAALKGKIDLIAIKDGKCFVIETKTGKIRDSDKIQLLIYIWALTKSDKRFQGANLEGLLIYESCEIEVSALEVNEEFLKIFSKFTFDIVNGEPDRKFPSPRECRWCKVSNCDERAEFIDNTNTTDYVPDFF